MTFDLVQTFVMVPTVKFAPAWGCYAVLLRNAMKKGSMDNYQYPILIKAFSSLVGLHTGT